MSKKKKNKNKRKKNKDHGLQASIHELRKRLLVLSPTEELYTPAVNVDDDAQNLDDWDTSDHDHDSRVARDTQRQQARRQKKKLFSEDDDDDDND